MSAWRARQGWTREFGTATRRNIVRPVVTYTPFAERILTLESPGYFKTELTEALVNNETFSAWLIGRTPSRRWGDVEDLVGAAIFLTSSASNFVNGHILYVDGGVTATL